MQTSLTRSAPSIADDITSCVMAGHHTLLPGDLSCSVLDGIAAGLAASGYRVLRPTNAAALKLSGLLAQIVGRPADRTLTDTDLELAFELLTDAGPEHSGIALLLDRADALDAAALRYIHLATRESPLRLVFAGGAGFDALLEREEFAALRRSFVRSAGGPTPATLPAIVAPAPIAKMHIGLAPIAPGPIAPGPIATAPMATMLPTAQPIDPLPGSVASPWQRTDRRAGRCMFAALGLSAVAAFVLWLVPANELATYLHDLPVALRGLMHR